MRPHSKPQAGAGPWVLWDWTRAMGINSWERRREKGTTPPGSSQHMVGLSISFDDSMIVLLWRGPSIFHLHLALADHFSLGAEREVLKVAFIFLGPGHSSSGSRSHLVGRLSVGPCNASVFTETLLPGRLFLLRSPLPLGEPQTKTFCLTQSSQNGM